MTDPSDFSSSGAQTPGALAAEITKADSDLGYTTRSIYVGGTGDLAVKMAGDGAIVVFESVPAGAVLPIRVTQIRSTDTTATLIVAIR